MNIELYEGQGCEVYIALNGDFEVYGGTTKSQFTVTRTGDEYLVTIPGQSNTSCYDPRFDIFARRASTGQEWLVVSGRINLKTRRSSDRTDVISSVEYHITKELVESGETVDGGKMIVGIKGDSAYDIARANGYEGSEAEYSEMVTKIPDYTDTAVTAANDALSFKHAALTSELNADNSAEAAKTSEDNAAQSESDAKAHMDAAAEYADSASKSADAAQQSETAAAKSAQDALANQQAAEQASQDAAQAQVAANAAKTDAEAAKVGAQTAEGNAKASASQASADKTAAEQAKQDALAAQTKAEQEAVKAEQNAALLGDAALMSGDNTFTGSNVFNGALSGNGTLCGIQMQHWLGMSTILSNVRLTFEQMKLMFPEPANIEVLPCFNCTAYGTNDTHQYFKKLKTVFAVVDNGNIWTAPSITYDGRLPEIWIHVKGSSFWLLHFSAAAKCNYFFMPDWAAGDKAITLAAMYDKSSAFLLLSAPKMPILKLSGHWNLNFQNGWKILLMDNPSPAKKIEITAKTNMEFVNANFANCSTVSITNTKLDKTSLLALIGSLPAYDSATMDTVPAASIHVDPELQGDTDVETALLNLQTAVEDGGKGWTVAVTGITLGGAATIALDTIYYYARREDADGSYIDSTGQRWDISGGTTVLRNYEANEQVAGYSAFLSMEDALEQWGLHEITPEESKVDYERRYGKID